MLETLSKGFKNARLKLQGKTTLSEDNISEALRDVRVSLLEADVELGVVKSFLQKVKDRSVGEVVALKGPRKGANGMTLTPGDHFIKICHDELVGLMGPVDATLDLTGAPAVVMMVGLQGSGKTTTAGKLAKKLVAEGKKPLLVAADIYRPAAIDQLVTIGRKLGLPVFSIKGMDPVALSTMAITQAKNVGRDVVIIDTAGRLAIDDTLMQELEKIREVAAPKNILFVCDAMIGQDAVKTAAEFDRRLGFTGFVLTKLDGDARGGAALSIKEVTGKPIKFLGMGETLDKLDEFRPEGLADRILGFGDVVGLVKDFEKVVDKEEAEQDAMKMLKGEFTFGDFLKQIGMLKKMGSIRSLFERLPGMGELLDQIPPEALDDNELVKVEAMIHSMTKQERNHPDVLDESRFRRISRGSGRDIQEVRELFSRFKMVRGMMGGLGAMMGGGGFPGMAGAGAGGGFPGMPGMGGRAQRRQMGMQSEAPNLSAEEKVKRAKEKQAQRKARKANRKHR
jgi:signal recognition particle subunit SRP54